jgi:hypothetical protein
MALLTALHATALLMALGLSILLLGSAETTLASHDRDARAIRYASRAAATVAEADLRALPSWGTLGMPGAIPEVSATPGPFIDATLAPAPPWGGSALDLRALTVRLQTDSDSAAPSGGPAPPWRLFEYGPLARLVPESAVRNPYYLVVWVADDAGIVVTRAVAYGPGEARSITEVSVQRVAVQGRPDAFRILTIRPGT